MTFAVSQTNVAGSPHSVSFSAPSVTVAAGAKATLDVTLNVPVATVGNSSAFREVAGLVTLTPGAGQNNGVALRVPYYLVPRALSNVTHQGEHPTLQVELAVDDRQREERRPDRG